MKKHLRWASWMKHCVAAAGVLALVSCKDDDDNEAPPTCTLADEGGCDVGTVCEEVVGGEPACFAPIAIHGTVADTATGEPIVGAHVVARDANGAAVSSVAETGEDGTYNLAVPVPRNADGTPASDETYTLRADAAGYLTFPKPPREALPVDTSEAAGEPAVIDNAATDIGLIALPDAAGLGTVSGTVVADDASGALIVIGGVTGVADKDGNFTVFNVPAGSHTVSGYKTGVELSSAEGVDVAAGETVEGVSLQSTGEATATVSGQASIVNAPGGSLTSVILVVEETFDPNVIRGEAPPGLRVGEVNGAWSMSGVPSGDYVVLAAFENDLPYGLVRDPDTSIGGTEIQHITVSGADVEVTGFKVTEALEVISPGAEGAEATNATPTFTWVDDSSEDEYNVKVYDALGELVWETTIPGVSGDDPTVEYAGPALETGMYYQFRVVSIKDATPISATEDLKGVFYVE